MKHIPNKNKGEQEHNIDLIWFEHLMLQNYFVCKKNVKAKELDGSVLPNRPKYLLPIFFYYSDFSFKSKHRSFGCCLKSRREPAAEWEGKWLK